jgi:uncharacterized protein (DUF2345 family)
VNRVALLILASTSLLYAAASPKPYVFTAEEKAEFFKAQAQVAIAQAELDAAQKKLDQKQREWSDTVNLRARQCGDGNQFQISPTGDPVCTAPPKPIASPEPQHAPPAAEEHKK